MSAVLWTLGLIFAQLSLLAFGGGATILPEMQRQVVEVHGWLTAPEFGALYALAQAAPGPNMMVVPLIGWHVAGWAGAAVSSVAMFGPSSIVTVVAVRLWDRFRTSPWRPVVQAGLMPVTAGLVAASAALITQATAGTWWLLAIAGLSAVLNARALAHPLVILAGGAILGLAAF